MRKFLLTMFTCAVFLLLQSSLQAQKIYVKAVGTTGDGSTLFKGGSLAKGHENEIEAIALSYLQNLGYSYILGTTLSPDGEHPEFPSNGGVPERRGGFQE